jgi:hypothetical protein
MASWRQIVWSASCCVASAPDEAARRCKGKRHPTLGDRVVVWRGATVLGLVTIGDGFGCLRWRAGADGAPECSLLVKMRSQPRPLARAPSASFDRQT